MAKALQAGMLRALRHGMQSGLRPRDRSYEVAAYIFDPGSGTMKLNGVTTARATPSPLFADASGDLVQYAANEVALVNGDSVACWPRFTNLIPYSRDFTTAAWSKSGTPVVSYDQVGIGGAPNTASRIEDDNASGYEGCNDQVVIPDDSNDVIATYYILQEDEESYFPSAGLGLKGGTIELSHQVQFNKKTGATTGVFSTDGSISVERKGDWWEVTVKVTNNGSGNTVAEAFVWPAHGASFGSPSNTATGYVIVGHAEVNHDQSVFYAPILTAGSAVAVDASQLKYTEVAGLTNNLAGRLYWTPLADDQGTVWILGNYTDANNGWGILHDGTNLIFRNRVSGSNNDATIALNYVVDTEYRIDYRLARDGLDIAVDGTKGTTDSTTTDLTNATNTFYGQDGNDSGHCFCTVRDHTEKQIASNWTDTEWLA